MVVSTENRFSVFKISERPTDLQLGCYFISLTTRVLKEPILGAWPISNTDLVVHYRTGRIVKTYRSDILEIPDIWQCWLHPQPPTLFMLRRASVVVFLAGKSYEFTGVPFFADGLAMYSPVSDVTFGQASCHVIPYTAYFVAQGITEKESFDELIHCVENERYFLELLGGSFVFVSEEDQDLWADFLIGRFENSELAKILEIAAGKVSDRNSWFAIEKLKWDELFMLFGKIVRDMFLLEVGADRFGRLRLEEVPDDFVEVALERSEVMRAFLWSIAKHIDFCPFIKRDNRLSTIGLMDAIPLFEKEFEEWRTVGDGLGTFRFLGSCLQSSGLERLALAVFVASRDPRHAASVFVVNEGLIEEAKDYMRTFQGTDAASLFQAVIDVDD
jgi:hypothetical protein